MQDRTSSSNRRSAFERCTSTILESIANEYDVNDNLFWTLRTVSRTLKNQIECGGFRRLNVRKKSIDHVDLKQMREMFRRFPEVRRKGIVRMTVEANRTTLLAAETTMVDCARVATFRIRWTSPPTTGSVSETFRGATCPDASSLVELDCGEYEGSLDERFLMRWIQRFGGGARRLSLKGHREIKPLTLSLIPRTMPMLEHLDLSGCRAIHPWEIGFGAPQVDDRFVRVLATTCDRMMWLSLARCTDVTDEGLRYLAKTKRLRHLNCSFCPITERGLRPILRTCTNLQELVASDCRLLQRSLGNLFDGATCRLRRIEIDGLRPSSEPLRDADGLAETISSFTGTLTTLSIAHGARISRTVLCAVAACSNLKELNVSYTQRVDAIDLSVLRSCRRLEDLRIDGVRACENGDPLESVVSACRDLQFLSIENTSIKSRRVDRWRRKVFPDCVVRNARGRIVAPASRFRRRSCDAVVGPRPRTLRRRRTH